MRVKWIGIGLLAASLSAMAEDGPKVEYKPLSIGALYEFGLLRSGRYGQWAPFRDEWMDHFGTFLTQSVGIGDNISMNIGLGGLFEYRKPQESNPPGWGGSQFKSFFVGPTVADINYKRPTGESSSWTLGAGMFNYKYNPDASNLGEYLFRTGAYPTYIWSGGYAFVNNAAAFGLQGLKGNMTLGGFSADAFFLTETGLAPLYDLSLAALLKYSTPGQFFSVFGGVNFKRVIPIRPSRTTRETAENSYFTRNGTVYSGNFHYYAEQAAFLNQILTDTARHDTLGFGARAIAFQAISDSLNPNRNNDTSIINGRWLTANGLPAGAEFYSITGTIVTGGLSLDFGKLLNLGILGPNDLRVYAEVALLGVKDYPVFYEKKSQRMPVMMGINLPGFKLLDLISVQVEYFNSPWTNSYYYQAQNQSALPHFPVGDDIHVPRTTYNALAAQDNVAWSVLIQKQLLKGLSANLQVAHDHVRAVSLQTYTGPSTDPNEVLTRKKDWYVMLQFGMGI